MPSIEDNRRRWNEEHDWSRGGEEWTPDEIWRAMVLEYGIDPYLEPGMRVLEIGPGAGRWSAEIVKRGAGRLIGVDLSELCVAMCRKRFAGWPQAEFHQNDGRDLGFLPNASIDFVWSFDVFVHMEADVIRSYFGHFARVLRPGGVGVVHYPSIDRAQLPDAYLGWRGHYTSAQMLELVDEVGFELLHDHYDPMISSTNTSVVVFRR